MFRVLTAISGMAIGAYATVKIVERRRRGVAMEELARVSALRRDDYGRCMDDIVRFDQDADNSPVRFKAEMNKARRPAGVDRVNDCLLITREFWGLVMMYDKEFGVFNTDSDKKEVYRKMYARYAPVARKYDMYDIYDQRDGYPGPYSVFGIKTFGNVYPTEEAEKE